jgi:hypothetical protein
MKPSPKILELCVSTASQFCDVPVMLNSQLASQLRDATVMFTSQFSNVVVVLIDPSSCASVVRRNVSTELLMSLTDV